MATDSTPMQEGPAYLRGQFLTLRALVMALASITTDQEEFLEAALQHLELLRTATLPEPVQDAQIAAIDEMEAFLKIRMS